MKTTKKPSAADVLAAEKKTLEDSILRACNEFERRTGLVVVQIRHPRAGDRLGARPLKDDERVDAGVIAPFIFVRGTDCY